ncbi:MAG: SH3 domain-containing protein [Desulfobacterales bacterium]|nr:MAG: SH3 domain-containing protein [Desulfobacterales bacterium]
MRIYSAITLSLILIGAGVARAERLAVSAPVANIRSGPGIDYAVLWKVEKYHPIFILKKSDSWYQFRDFEDDRGWVHASLVANIAAVITKSDKCNIRSGPGSDFEILFTVEKGVPFKVLERQGSWIHIEHADGDQGWIHGSLVW